MADVWTKEQVAKLTEFQRCGWVHAFTCGDRGDHPVIDGDKGVLVATTRGWICQCCDYTQDWAHDFMFNGAPPNPLAALRGNPDKTSMEDQS